MDTSRILFILSLKTDELSKTTKMLFAYRVYGPFSSAGLLEDIALPFAHVVYRECKSDTAVLTHDIRLDIRVVVNTFERVLLVQIP